ncbi:hypothetical protein GLOIN_2v1786010 [Rhizophagus irregularis DAOM 181602=DAOM 197198]|uniref:Uncharacterized protein n=1 Tax=Rhizophagus irregularis (strain DAOM 181602 / DAOM 197198 / MUCL 43194) TaxID=747089 RepID=A0A2P4P940_RHIID|nr:hypothetical protein GLOIN_2v1786010 [Rhizophagus irregularis DAOM 181602=DAOM 197198]POG61906.1 hypothetical protein GLOIN_2v1786010 [Rhizophagus irregularis DAOM 181602=DAOM 197198]|eukprot:XP_025168772.1 hypothetical protein GLOIN_2v1786010 [Rhizophagus irregularis DAOM 181602=DAOM 197198]
MELTYNFTEYRYRFLKESKELSQASSKVSEFTRKRTLSGSELNRVEDTFLELIRQEVMHKKISIKDIILKCAGMSYEVYREEMKRLSREASSKVSEFTRKRTLSGSELNRVEDTFLELIRQEVMHKKISIKDIILKCAENEKIRKVSQEVESMRLELKKAKSGDILVYDIPAWCKEDQIIKLKQDKAEWKSRHSINLMMDDKMYWFRWFPASMKLSEIRDRFKFVAYKEIKEDLRTTLDMDILEYYKYQGWFYTKIIFIKGKKFIYAYFANQDNGSVNPDHLTENVDVGTSSSKESNEGSGSTLKYMEKDVKAIVARAIEEQIKEKEMIKENVNQSIDKRKFCSKKYKKANAKEKISSSSTVMTSVDEEEIVELVNRYRKGALPARSLEKGLGCLM